MLEHADPPTAIGACVADIVSNFGENSVRASRSAGLCTGRARIRPVMRHRDADAGNAVALRSEFQRYRAEISLLRGSSRVACRWPDPILPRTRILPHRAAAGGVAKRTH